MIPAERRWAWTAAPLVYRSILAWLSSAPRELPDAMHFKFGDKVIHTAVFGGLGWLLLHAVDAWWPRRPHGQVVALAVLLGVLSGVLDEVQQSFVPGRTADVWDAVADTVGVLLGVGVALLQRNKRWPRSGA